MREDTVGTVATIVQVIFPSSDSSGGRTDNMSLHADRMVVCKVGPNRATLHSVCANLKGHWVCQRASIGPH